MVLFVLEHITALSQSIALRYTRFENEVCTLLLKNDFADSEYAKKLVSAGVFDKIIKYYEILGTGFSTENGYVQNICSYYNNIFSTNDIVIEEYNNIFVATDIINTPSIYFHLHNIEHSFIELHIGQYTIPQRYEQLFNMSKNSNPFEKEIYLKYSALTGESDLVNKRYLYSNNKDEIVNEKDEIVDFMKLFYSIDPKYKNILKDIFGSINMKNNNLFLFSGAGRVPLTPNISNPYLCYQMMCDYYLEENSNVIIKDHPNAHLGDIEKVFTTGNIQFLDKMVPLEFYALEDGFYIDKVISVATTATQKVDRYIGKNIDLKSVYFNNFTLTHQLYVSYALDEFLGLCRSYLFYGIHKITIENVKNLIFNNTKSLSNLNISDIKGDTLNIIDNIPQDNFLNIYNSLKNVNLITKVIFINSNKSFDFLNCFDESLLQCLIPFTIKKKKLRNNTICDIKDEMIYVFCKSTEMREKIRSFTFEKSLEFTGIEIFVNPMTELEIKEQQDVLRPIMNSKRNQE